MTQMHVAATATAQAAPEAVWALMADANSYAQWGPWRDAGYESPGNTTPHGVGAVRWVRYGRRTVAEQILEVDDGRRIAYTVVRGLPVRHYRAEVALTPVAEGTRIDWSATWDGTVAGRIVRHKLRSFFPDVVERLAATAGEARASQPVLDRAGVTVDRDPSPAHGRTIDRGVAMPGFVQIMELKTSRIDEVRALADKIQEEVGEGMRSTRVIVTEDRDRPGYYFVIGEFNSYEEAMEQSNDPKTDATSKRLVALLDGPPKFYNLDIIQQM